MEVLKIINNTILALFIIIYSYQLLFVPVSLLGRAVERAKRKKGSLSKPPALLRYAVLICARNEEAVIGELIDSIKSQTYPIELVTTFVLADNCTDATAEAARGHGAIVYERQDTKHVGKGYALGYLLARIGEDYGDIFDGYLVFDADNILMPDYIERMNEMFAGGKYEIITSYRNSKNYADNWISAGYGLNFLRDACCHNHARSLLGTSCFVSGTGFLFSRRIKNKIGGWTYHMLSEDIEFTADQITSGVQIGFCRAAEFFDEQPTDFIQSWHQRMRWSKGYLQMYRKYGKKLILGFLCGNFACFDLTMSTLPAMLLSFVGIVANVTLAVAGSLLGDNIMIAVESLAESSVRAYLTLYALGLLITLVEWKRIRTTAAKKLLYTFTFPLLMFTYIPIAFTALFARVTWKPIKHSVTGRTESLISTRDDAL